MYLRLLDFLRCPSCQATLESIALESQKESDSEISTGLLRCVECSEWYPIIRGVPRMLPDALQEHWPILQTYSPQLVPDVLRALTKKIDASGAITYDQRTRQNFSYEWDNYQPGGTTWGMQLADRVSWFFLDPVRISEEDLRGKILLDAGCGNGSQSVAYTAYGLEVIAIDLSSGLEHGYAYRDLHAGADPTRVHFVQANLQHPPLAPESVDIIHSAGVLHHTPNTLQTFRALLPILRPEGTFYVWLYKHEKWVTPLIKSIRAITTRVSPANFASVARLMSVPFIGFCKVVNALGIRSYSKLNRREATLALMDIFGAPYAYDHSFDEVAGWYKAEGFSEVWPCNESRRGFGVCGRLSAGAKTTREAVYEI